jgi:CheY-like chemotaxis protein
MTAPNSVLLIAPEANHFHIVTPVVTAGYECVQVQTSAAGCAELDRQRPLMILLDCQTAVTEGGAGCARLRAHRTNGDVPIVLIATEETPAEVLEEAWNAGADDCILRPVRLAHIKSRASVLATDGTWLRSQPRRPPRTVMVAGGGASREVLGRLLEFSGYHLFYGPTGDSEPQTTRPGPVDMIVVCGELTQGLLDVLRADPAMAGVRILFRSDAEAAVSAELPEGVIQMGQLPLEKIVQRINDDLNESSAMIRAEERVPFFCPVEFREVGTSETAWASSLSHDISTAGIFLKTLVPIRKGACVDLKIHMTTSREVIEGTGVVKWANPYAARRVFSYPVGMGIQFLGMSPKPLAKLRELCKQGSR